MTAGDNNVTTSGNVKPCVDAFRNYSKNMKLKEYDKL